MRELVDEIQVVDVEAHYDFAAAGTCGSRDHRAEMKRIKSPTNFSAEHRSSQLAKQLCQQWGMRIVRGTISNLTATLIAAATPLDLPRSIPMLLDRHTSCTIHDFSAYNFATISYVLF